MPTMSGAEQLFCRSAPWGAWTRKVVLPWALQGVNLNGDVLEVGAGSGAMAFGTLHAHPQARLTLTDIDPAMVTAISKRLDARTDITVTEADATRLPFDDASFDFVVSYLMLHHVVNWKTALTEIHRVLRPGGQLVGYDLTNTRLARLIHVVDRSPHRLISPRGFEQAITAERFTDVRVRGGFAGHVMRFTATAA